MNKVRSYTKILFLAALGMGFSMLNGQSAQALTSSFNLDVNANVVNSCTIATSAVTFATNYDVTSGTANTGNGSVTINCTTGAPVYVTLGQGAQPGVGSTDPLPVREMSAGGTDRLGYQLYQNVGLSTVWGNTQLTGVPSTGTGSAVVIPVYGSIPAGQAVASGAYADGVLATVNY